MIKLKFLSKFNLLLLLIIISSCNTITKRSPKFTLSPTTEDFGTITIGSSSNPTTFTITNSGNRILNVSSIDFSGKDAADFSINATLPINVEPTFNSTFTVTFTPLTDGVKSATMTVTHNAVGSPAKITLSGMCVDPLNSIFSITPTSQDFGHVIKGRSSNPVTFTISNPGIATLYVTSITLTGTDAGEFTLNALLPMNVAHALTSDFTVTFSPTSTGVKSALMEIEHNAIGSPSKINITGIGDPDYLLIFEDDFSTNKGWVNDNGPSHTGNASWLIFPDANDTGGSGAYYRADSNYNHNDVFDEYLVSPLINCSGYTTGTITLEFDGNYHADPYTNTDLGKLVVFDGVTWITLETYMTSWSSVGEYKTYDVSTYALGNSDFKVGFYYTGFNNLYFNVDNIKVSFKP